jgi:hypothetical protein
VVVVWVDGEDLLPCNKSNAIEYYVYDYQGNRVRTVVESNHQTQSQRDYLPSLDLSTNQAKQQSSTPVAFLLGLGFVFASNDGSASIGIVVFVAEGLGFVIQL